jgi:hypothetical protein
MFGYLRSVADLVDLFDVLVAVKSSVKPELVVAFGTV